MGVITRNSIVTDGLVLNLDSLNPQSVPLDPTVNIFRSGSNFTSSAWSVGGLITASSALGPDGTNNTFIFSAISPYNTVSQATTVSQGFYTVSYYVKYINQPTITIVHEGNPYYVGTYNLQNVTAAVGGTVGFTSNAFIEPAPNGFYRIGMTLNVTESSKSLNPRLWMGLYSGIDYSGSQVYVANAQLERSNYATPFTVTSRTTWRDLSGNNNLGTLTTGSVLSSIPKYNSLNQRILNFDGTGSYSQTNAIITSSTYTFETVFNATSIPGGVEKWLGSQYPGNDRVIFDIYTDNKLRSFLGSGTNPSSAFILSTTVIQPNTWYHAVFTKDTLGTGSIYVNGVLEVTGALGLSVPPAVPFQIGGSTTLTRWFTGKITNVKLYNRALSQQEVSQNYNAIKTRYGLT